MSLERGRDRSLSMIDGNLVRSSPSWEWAEHLGHGEIDKNRSKTMARGGKRLPAWEMAKFTWMHGMRIGIPWTLGGIHVHTYVFCVS